DVAVGADVPLGVPEALSPIPELDVVGVAQVYNAVEGLARVADTRMRPTGDLQGAVVGGLAGAADSTNADDGLNRDIASHGVARDDVGAVLQLEVCLDAERV